MSVDFPAPFCPIKACTSPGRTSRSTPASAWTPGNRFCTPRATRTGSVLTRTNDLRRVRLLEELVLALDELLDRLPPADLVDGVEDERTHERVALDGGVELASDHRLEGPLHRVHRDDGDALARLHPGLVQGLDGTQGHVVVVGVDGLDLIAIRLDERLHDFLALCAGEVG